MTILARRTLKSHADFNSQSGHIRHGQALLKLRHRKHKVDLVSLKFIVQIPLD